MGRQWATEQGFKHAAGSLDRMHNSLGVFSMHFATSKYELLLPDRKGPESNIVPGEQLDEVDRFSYFIS